MAFENEYVLASETEQSDFFKKARVILQTGHSKFDFWTVDRQREMALVNKGSGHEVESANSTVWGFLDQRGKYFFSTEKLDCNSSSDEINATFKLLGFWKGDDYLQPSPDVIVCIKDALTEYQKIRLFDLNHYKSSRLTLISESAGGEA